jgi:hypothetical protein
MITPAYALTATERVLPNMALDFTTGVLDSRVTIARALNTATCVNSSGFVEIVNANLPRFDYNPVTLAPKGLLIEEARTNLMLYSEQLNNLTWVKFASSVTANSTNGPDGALTADTLTENTATGQHGVYQGAAVVSGTAYSFSGYVKANGRSIVQFLLQATGNVYFVEFNLTNVTTTNRSGTGTATITDAGNGWYRITATATATGTGLGYWQLNLCSAANTISYTGDGVSGVFLWGAQMEAGAFATSYIPTVASTVTRNADVVSMTGTNFSSWYNASAGMFVVDADIIGFNANNMLLAVTDSGSTNLIQQFLVGATTSRFLVRTSGSDQAAMDSTISASAVFRIASAYAANNFATAANGGAIQTDTIGTIPTVDRLGIGSRIGSLIYNGHVCAIRYYPLRPTNAEVQAFSKQ